MLVYPQLTSGALAQFPLVRRRRARTIDNTLEDGSSLKLSDPGGGSTEWKLRYSGLSDTEIAALQQFFAAAEGSLNGFTFLDPAGNLLAESEALENRAWTLDPQLSLQNGAADPAGGSSGWHLQNRGGGPQSLAQTLQAPGIYIYCFSVYVRSDQPGTVTLRVGTRSAVCATGSKWERIRAIGSGGSQASSVALAIELGAGGEADIFGPQAEAQLMPSTYRRSTTGGVYPNARFGGDSFRFTTEGPNRHSATVTIFHANHL